ncbi:single-strand DNA endonuclease ASTE1 [Hyperolius riggenbachi]|uniref:single-strand DNA endonuclease ASTE1 n=1 Tax=Hyperolius riggenbachi TaxID=752182 RepID=UPI0035A2C2A2
MGIQGLMSYVSSNRSFFQDVQMRNSRLIIDGNNLYYKLYFDSGLDLVHGGDYNSFTHILNKFFETLTVCNIQPYVVFDGGCDISNKKLATQKQRLKEKIKMAHSLSTGRGGIVIPLLIRDVCMQALTELNVPFVQCFSEADREIVALANLWNCPVLTFDSDFCIFDLKAGYCPHNGFQWKNIGTTKESHECYIPARCFLAQRLCSHFNNMSKSLLPLFAVLTGNDYISLSALETFFSKIHLPVGNNHGGRKQTRIEGLFIWLSGFLDVEEAMENVLGYLKLKDRESVRQLLYSAMEEYNLYDTVNLEHFFQGGLYVSPTAVQLNLPSWVQVALAKGRLSPLLSDALVLRRVFLHAQVEDFRKPSAHCVAQPIRKAMYALLLRACQKSQTRQHETSLCKQIVVEEYDRLDTTLRKSNLEVGCAYEECPKDVTLQHLPEAPLSTRLELLLRASEVTMAELESVPPAHQLTVVAVCYWIRHADPKVKLYHCKAVVMEIVYGEIDKNLNRPEFQADDIQSVCEQMERIKSEGAQNRKLSSEDLHIMCQLQCCFQMLLFFNQLLCTPLPEPDVTRMYNGSLVYHLVQKLKTSAAVEELFKPCPPLEKLYQDCIGAIKSAVPPECFQSKTKSTPSKPKKKAKASKTSVKVKLPSVVENQPQCETSNRFAGLLLED